MPACHLRVSPGDRVQPLLVVIELMEGMPLPFPKGQLLANSVEAPSSIKNSKKYCFMGFSRDFSCLSIGFCNEHNVVHWE